MPVSHDWFGFTSDWMTKWREIIKPISRRSKANLIKVNLGISIDSQMKTAKLYTVDIYDAFSY